MASLRKKPLVAVANADTENPVAIGIDSQPTAPAPTPAPVKNEADQALAAQLEAMRHAESLQQTRQQAIATAEGRRKEWLQSNPLAQQHYDHLGGFHNEALQSGLADTSPGYFQHMESRLASLQPSDIGAHLIDEMQQRTALERTPPAPERHRISASFVSAPVSREVPSASGIRSHGRTTLSPVEVEHARIAGVPPEEYAKQKLKFEAMKASGEYGDRR